MNVRRYPRWSSPPHPRPLPVPKSWRWWLVLLSTLLWGGLLFLAQAGMLDPPTYKALLIGINDYSNNHPTTGWPDLKAAERDTDELYRLLTTRYGFLPSQVKYLQGKTATRDNIIKALNNILSTATNQDSVLIYFAGHGAIHEGVYYWVPADADRSIILSGVPTSPIELQVNYSRARHVLLIADSCFAGYMASNRTNLPTPIKPREPEEYERLLKAKGRHLLVSTDRTTALDETVRPYTEEKLYGGHSPFAAMFLGKLKSNPFGWMDAKEIEAAIADQLYKETRQWADLKTLKNEYEGMFVFYNQQASATRVSPSQEGLERDKGPQTGGGTIQATRIQVSSNLAGKLLVNGKQVVDSGMLPVSLELGTGPGTVELELRGSCETIKRPVLVQESSQGKVMKVELNATNVCTALPEGKAPITWVSIPGTGPEGFWMGSPEGEGSDDERPRHKVTVPAFQMSKTEVTNAQYNTCVKAGKCTAPGWDTCYSWIEGSWKEVKAPESFKEDNKPVVCVDWFQARTYAAWVGEVSGMCVRLPTEAEWEYVGTGGGKTKYAGTDDLSKLCEYGNVADQTAKAKYSGWSIVECKDGYAETAPVGQFKEGAWGLKDLTGNVWEWTEDCYHSSYQDSPPDGSAWLTGCQESDKSALRVVRGGAWNTDPDGLRSSYRDRDGAGWRDGNQGFRLVAVSSRPCHGLQGP